MTEWNSLYNSCTYKVISYRAGAGIWTGVRRVQSNHTTIWAIIHWRTIENKILKFSWHFHHFLTEKLWNFGSQIKFIINQLNWIEWTPESMIQKALHHFSITLMAIKYFNLEKYFCSCGHPEGFGFIAHY